MRSIGKTLCALGLALSVSSCGALAPAYAAPVCGDAVQFVEKLTEAHQVQVGGGIVTKDAILVIYATPGGELWTAITMGTDGSACLVMQGKEWFGGLPPMPVPGERGA